jgi:hypothetical protein
MSTRSLAIKADPSVEYAVPRVHAKSFHVPSLHAEPRVVVDAAPTWPAVQRWNPGYLRDVLGESEVRVREVTGLPVNIFQKAAGNGWISFGDYLDWVLEIDAEVSAQYTQTEASTFDMSQVYQMVAALGFECSYYLSGSIAEVSPVLREDICIPDWLGTDTRSINLWCGAFGTSCGLHCDLAPNCNVQIVGRKHFVLYPPGQTRLLYRINGRTHCRFDPNVPDFDRFPRARAATRWVCTLQPGEAIYIPSGWFHQVTVVSGWAVNVNAFWHRPFQHTLMAPALWPHLFRQARGIAMQRVSRWR